MSLNINPDTPATDDKEAKLFRAHWFRANKRVLSRTTSLPGSPAVGDIYIIPTGDPDAESIAFYYEADWHLLVPEVGWVAYIIDDSENVQFDGAVWDLVTSGGDIPLSYLDTDVTLAANSDLKVATQKAVKTYADALIAANDAMVFKGVTDCSANPNYPAADRGWMYRVSVAGKIGGASGIDVEVGDMFICLDDGTASGTQAAQGTHWSVIQANLTGAVSSIFGRVGAVVATAGDYSADLIDFDPTGLINISGSDVQQALEDVDAAIVAAAGGGIPTGYLDTDGTLAANSDVKVATQKAVKTYADQLIATADAMTVEGVINCSANPNYPAADAGNVYIVSVAGRIGGGSGPRVEIADRLLCITDGSASGNHATVGANWVIGQANIDGAVIGPSSVTDNNLSVFDGATGKLLKELTYTTVTALLNSVVGDSGSGGTKGLVPAPGSGDAAAGKFLKADGTFAVPPGTGGFTTASTTEVLTGTNSTKGVTPDALAALWEKGSDVASSGTISLGEGGLFHITGTSAITDIDFTTEKDGRFAILIFDGALTFTHNATTLQLPGNANITTAAGDRAIIVQDNGDNIICVDYRRADGSVLNKATAAQIWAATTNKALTADNIFTAADPVTLTDAATIVVDMGTFLNGKVTLAGNRTLGAPSNVKNGQSGCIEIIQDGTGARTLAYHADYLFAGGTDPTLSTAAGTKDLLFYQVLSNGKTYANLVKAVA